MYWQNFSDFIAMGTHALYVWGSVFAVVLAVILEPIILVYRKKRLERTLIEDYEYEAKLHTDEEKP